jgi:hypothetical protein
MPRKLIHKSPMKARQVVQPHNLRQTFMIFTEGQTEEGYFKKFKVRCKTIPGGNALRNVEEAIIQKKQLKKPYDEYWVVFDQDATPKNDFLKAISLATANGLKVAYSCQAFEIWWLFHFTEIAAPIQRKDYEKKLKKHLPDYKQREKGQTQGERMWLQLNKLKETGIANAKKAHTKFPQPELAFDQSVTTVYELVEFLGGNSIR